MSRCARNVRTRSIRVRAFGFTAILAALLVPPRATAQTWTWTIENVDTVGKFTSLVIDAQGDLHLSYVHDSRGVMYGFRPAHASTWFTMVIDPGTSAAGQTTGIALDPQGNPHICFTPGPLKYASFDGKQWKTEWIGAGSATLEFTCSVAISGEGTPHIIWYQTKNQDGSDYNHIKHAVRENGVWQTQTVDYAFETGKWNSLALDSRGMPHFTYSSLSGGELKYAVWDAQRWSLSVLESRNFSDGGTFNRGFGSSLMLDRKGDPAVSYYDDKSLKYATWNGGHWKIQVVDRVTSSNSWSVYRSTLLLDRQDVPHICYEDAGALKHAYWDGLKWKIQYLTVSGGRFGRHASMAVGPNNELFIAYRDPIDNSLKMAVGRSSEPAVKASTAVEPPKENH